MPQENHQQNNSETCFICNITSQSYVDLYGSSAPHSGKCIFNFVWKFLGGKPSVRNDATDASSMKPEVVCTECVTMINQYDAARVVAKRYKKQLREKLTSTEAHFASRLERQTELTNICNGMMHGNEVTSQTTDNNRNIDNNKVIDLSDDE